MSGRLAGRRALVWGGGTGLGYAGAHAMVTQGARVFVAGRREAKLRDAAAELSRLGQVGFRAGDVTVPIQGEEVTEAAAAFMGGLDTVVISAGLGAVGTVVNVSVEDFCRVVEANLLPVFLATKHAAPHLLKEGHGAVIAIASIYGIVGQMERVAYCTAKAGVINLVRSMALDFATKGITVNAISPGFVETDLTKKVLELEKDSDRALRAWHAMHPIPRAGRPEEIGRAIAYLASDDATWITGQNWVIDGGYTAR